MQVGKILQENHAPAILFVDGEGRAIISEQSINEIVRRVVAALATAK